MAQDFPLSLQQLLPIMDVIGYANKYLKRVRICGCNVIPAVQHLSSWVLM